VEKDNNSIFRKRKTGVTMDVSKCMQTKLVLSKPDCVFKTLLVKIIA